VLALYFGISYTKPISTARNTYVRQISQVPYTQVAYPTVEMKRKLRLQCTQSVIGGQ
jgi:hypothetical protein